MTFCLGMATEDGLVGIADTRVTTGSECITAKKLVVYESPGRAFFLMTAGLRSVRDKAVTYFEETLEGLDSSVDRLFKVVNVFADQLRRVAREDKHALEESGLEFRFSALIGGQIENDPEHKLYLVYAQGNWVEIGRGSPYAIIGAVGYGKPVLDRTLHYHDTLQHALKVGCLAFDSTRISAADVDFPIDVVICRKGSFRIVERRYDKEDLNKMTTWWQEKLRENVESIPAETLDQIFESDVSSSV